MNVLLQVENQKGVEVCFEPSLEECFLARASNDTSTPNLTPVTISSYSKDENVLNSSIAKTRIQISSVPKGFCQYLFDRKKAGVIKFRDTILYVLPPNNRNDLTLPCISPSTSSTAPSHLKQVALTPVEEFPKSVHASSIATKISAPPTSSTPVAGGGIGGDAFFSSLLNKVQVTPSTSSLRICVVEEYRYNRIDFEEI